MHPAYSIIFFTTASGAGYGLLVMSILSAALGLVPTSRGLGLALLGTAGVLIVAGLLSSLLHLAHPERAWRALSQWRSSWLSREGVLAVAGLMALASLALGWVVEEALWAVPAALTVALALATILATSMIYASLKPIRAWSSRLVPPAFLALGLANGALVAAALVLALGVEGTLLPAVAVLLTLLAWGIKLAYWREIDTAGLASTPEAALGLAGRGSVSLLELPHAHEGYLLREMGYRVGRKHAAKLRRIAVLAAAGGLLLLAATTLAPPGALRALAAALTILAGIGAVLVERWLFFAEARHSVTLYYGAR